MALKTLFRRNRRHGDWNVSAYPIGNQLESLRITARTSHIQPVFRLLKQIYSIATEAVTQ